METKNMGNVMCLLSGLLLGPVQGAFACVLLYLSKSYIEHRFVLGLPLEAVMITLSQKAVVSSVNAIVSIIVAVPLGIALRPAVRRYLQ